MDAQEQSKLTAEIERDEAWFADVVKRFPAPAFDGLQSIKHRVRIAVHEQVTGIAEMRSPAPSPEVVDRIKAAVRAELAGAPATRQPQEHRVLIAWWSRYRVALGTLAAAAVLAFAFLPLGGTDGGGESGGGSQGIQVARDAVPAIEDFVAYVSEASVDGTVEFAVLEAELDDLEQLVVSPTDSWFDDEVSDLDDELDRLTNDTDWSLDV